MNRWKRAAHRAALLGVIVCATLVVVASFFPFQQSIGALRLSLRSPGNPARWMVLFGLAWWMTSSRPLAWIATIWRSRRRVGQFLAFVWHGDSRQNESRVEHTAKSRLTAWILIAAVFVAAHAVSAWLGYQSLNHTLRVATDDGGSRALTLDATFDEWAAGLGEGDAGHYLRVAVNVAQGRGCTVRTDTPDGPQWSPFYYWGPGAPAVLGVWIWLTGGQTMHSLFAFAVVWQMLFGAIVLLTALVYTRSTLSLCLTVFLSGVCPPLQSFFYTAGVTSSEIVAIVPLALTFLALAKAFDGFWRRSEPPARAAFWIALAGVFLGLSSLVRDALVPFAFFTAVVIVARSLWIDRRRWLPAAAAAGLVIMGTWAARWPVQLWNQERIGAPIVSTGAQNGVWQLGLWAKHDANEWYQECGVGFGEYLDPAAARRVNEYFEKHLPQPALYSLSQFLQALWHHPAAAVDFKVRRLPMLWLGTSPWPRSQWTWVSAWCVGCYASLLAYLAVRRRRRLPIPEPLYLYVAFLACASALIQFEFRYSYPVWNMLVLAPGLLLAELLPARQTQRSAAVETTAMDAPALAA